jgi:hypothetical protein
MSFQEINPYLSGWQIVGEQIKLIFNDGTFVVTQENIFKQNFNIITSERKADVLAIINLSSQ